VMGEEGVPQGVSTLREATGVKPGRDWRPVPPITAMEMGPGVLLVNCLSVMAREDVWKAWSKYHLLHTVIRVSDVSHFAKSDVCVSFQRGFRVYSRGRNIHIAY
jgi:hypothetical protein